VKGNFFDRLAARTLGLAPVAQPILPAKFSPATKTNIQPQAFAVTSETAEMPAAASPPLCTPQTVPPATIPVDDDPGAASHESDSQRRKPSRQDVDLPETDAALLPETTLKPAAIEAASSTLPQPEPPLPQRLRIPHESAIAATPNQPLQSTPSRPQTITAQVFVRGAAEFSSQDPVHHVSEQRASSLQSGSEPSTPIVRVTIGRVEVRAQFPAASAQQPPRRSRASSLSLEDYLKQRSGGKR
jgi:hypothetical protein